MYAELVVEGQTSRGASYPTSSSRGCQSTIKISQVEPGLRFPGLVRESAGLQACQLPRALILMKLGVERGALQKQTNQRLVRALKMRQRKKYANGKRKNPCALVDCTLPQQEGTRWYYLQSSQVLACHLQHQIKMAAHARDLWRQRGFKQETVGQTKKKWAPPMTPSCILIVIHPALRLLHQQCGFREEKIDVIFLILSLSFPFLAIVCVSTLGALDWARIVESSEGSDIATHLPTLPIVQLQHRSYNQLVQDAQGTIAIANEWPLILFFFFRSPCSRNLRSSATEQNNSVWSRAERTWGADCGDDLHYCRFHAHHSFSIRGCTSEANKHAGHDWPVSALESSSVNLLANLALRSFVEFLPLQSSLPSSLTLDQPPPWPCFCSLPLPPSPLPHSGRMLANLVSLWSTPPPSIVTEPPCLPSV